jgi:uncharacterized protein (DUF1697 family)
MDRFVALYRGINVGGNNPVKMEALRAMHERLGHREVTSHVQSGNIVFSAKGTAETIANNLASGFASEFGFAPKIIVVPGTRWAALVQNNPYAAFSAVQPTTVHAAICVGKPDAKGLKALFERAGGTEEFRVKDDAIYLHAPDGFGTSKFAAGMERAAGVAMTARNWRTVEALSGMLEHRQDPR